MKKTILSALLSLSLAACVAPNNTPTPDAAGNNLASGNPLPQDPQVTETSSPFTMGTPSTLKPIPIDHARKVQDDIYTSNYQEYPEVVRYDRYTLVSSSPVGGQKYLLEQLVQVNMLGKKKTYTLSVEQGLWNTLKNTGFTLCSVVSPDVRSLFSHQLPKVHYQFGPMKLREALQMLSGEAYELTVNDTLRQVCFERRSTIPKMATPQPQVESSIDQTQ